MTRTKKAKRPRPQAERRPVRRFIFFVLAAALAGWLYHRFAPPVARAPEKFTPAAVRLEAGDLPGLGNLDAEYIKLVETVVPAVVSVNSTRTVRVPVGDISDYLFGWRGRVMEKPESMLGSGVIVSKEGHILTNHHVVAGMQEIQVQLTDGRTLPVKLIGSDPAVDIAVLQLDAKDLTALPIADSDQVRVGQQVFAVGNPFGLQETVTRGIVSAKGRALRDSGVEFFQTDAAVNPGNSGGPLLNIRGEIIGINSAISTPTGAWAGISFAIPANVARRTLESILRTGRPVRGYLGVSMMPLSRALADRFGVPDLRGALIADVVPGSPAERAGIKPGDVIRSFNGKPINDAAAFRDHIALAGVGARVKLGVFRAGQEEQIEIEIAEAPSQAAPLEPAPAPRVPAPSAPSAPEPGRPKVEPKSNVLSSVSVGPMPSSVRDALPEKIQGVIVTQVEPDSPAGEKLRVGDLIQEVNKRPVTTVEEYEAAAQSIGAGQRALLFILRGRSSAFVVIAP